MTLNNAQLSLKDLLRIGTLSGDNGVALSTTVEHQVAWRLLKLVQRPYLADRRDADQHRAVVVIVRIPGIAGIPTDAALFAIENLSEVDRMVS